MGLLTESEPAIQSGYGIELLRYLSRNCPKRGEDLKLSFKVVDGERFYDENALRSYITYLNSPWPKGDKQNRPPLPEAIKEDVKQECHHECAICGRMDNGEVAHIAAVSDSMNNAPENLILLCPNHHTKYDLGFKPSSNVTFEVICAAKTMKRTSRLRVLRYEANTTRYLANVMSTLKKLSETIQKESSAALIEVYTTELRNLAKDIPANVKSAMENASRDVASTATEARILENAPKIASLLASPVIQTSDQALRTAVKAVSDLSDEILIDIDEVECPHCFGRGLTGLMGDFCGFCHGSCVVTNAKAESYDKDEMDEVECPHCNGHGMTGLVGDICGYCRGSCVVSQEEADSYDPDQLDEVECPHCNGCGTTGLAGDICRYCRGSCVVSVEEADSYDPDELDEVECPHCFGRGMTGLNSKPCSYCRGSCRVGSKFAEEYDPEQLGEVECPHCSGRGTKGYAGDFCQLCNGDQVVSEQKAEAYWKKFGSRRT